MPFQATAGQISHREIPPSSPEGFYNPLILEWSFLVLWPLEVLRKGSCKTCETEQGSRQLPPSHETTLFSPPSSWRQWVFDPVRFKQGQQGCWVFLFSEMSRVVEVENENFLLLQISAAIVSVGVCLCLHLGVETKLLWFWFAGCVGLPFHIGSHTVRSVAHCCITPSPNQSVWLLAFFMCSFLMITDFFW